MAGSPGLCSARIGRVSCRTRRRLRASPNGSVTRLISSARRRLSDRSRRGARTRQRRAQAPQGHAHLVQGAGVAGAFEEGGLVDSQVAQAAPGDAAEHGPASSSGDRSIGSALAGLGTSRSRAAKPRALFDRPRAAAAALSARVCARAKGRRPGRSPVPAPIRRAANRRARSRCVRRPGDEDARFAVAHRVDPGG